MKGLILTVTVYILATFSTYLSHVVDSAQMLLQLSGY